MASYHTFTTSRETPFDAVALQASLRAAVSDATAVLGGIGPYTGKKAQPWTAPEITAAQAALDTAPVRDDAALDVDQKVLKALAAGLWECIPNPTMTKAQLRTRILAIWRTL